MCGEGGEGATEAKMDAQASGPLESGNRGGSGGERAPGADLAAGSGMDLGRYRSLAQGGNGEWRTAPIQARGPDLFLCRCQVSELGLRSAISIHLW